MFNDSNDYSFSAISQDNFINLYTSDLITPKTTNLPLTGSAVNLTLPTVNITTLDNLAAETLTGKPLNTGKFQVTRSGSTNTSLTVFYSRSGTALNNVDFNSLSGSVTIPAGQTNAIITVTPKDDSISESTETVIATLTAKTNYNLGSNIKGTVNIQDNDVSAKPTVSITATDSRAIETSGSQSPNTGQFQITRTGSTSAPLTVIYTMTGTATNGSDYDSLTGSVTIAAGQTSATITVKPKNDNWFENTETAVATLQTNTNYNLNTNKQATVSIKPYLEVNANQGDYEFLTRIISKNLISQYQTVDVDPASPGNEGILTPSGQIYKVVQYIDDLGTNLQIGGLISESGAPPVLAIGGLNVSTITDEMIDRLNVSSPGKQQFTDNQTSIKQFIDNANSFLTVNQLAQRVDLTGYSLGGAIAQQAASYFTSTNYLLGELVTFNSPGIAAIDVQPFRSANVRAVTHYVVNGDIVSLMGEKFIPGNYKLVSWDTPLNFDPETYAENIVTDKHNGSLTNQFYLANINKRSGVTIIDNFNGANFLSDPLFSYGIWEISIEDWSSFNIILTLNPELVDPALAFYLTDRGTLNNNRDAFVQLLKDFT
ncbi:MAG: hypothetical protein N5P05_003213 [Chroococcopsis gigantea SAG 12.99]|jgi:hypothetical protein|nr:hypothetical protein [Chlorogloea purpurea SAG 13.99]MDV3001607.1 hypothetical protein [Chroococcopsis gigantea SAG 12.99]